MIPQLAKCFTFLRISTIQAFTESAKGLVGVVGSFDFATSVEQGDFASLDRSATVVLLSFVFASFRAQTWPRNILSNCSFWALSASNSLSRELFSEFRSSLS